MSTQEQQEQPPGSEPGTDWVAQATRMWVDGLAAMANAGRAFLPGAGERSSSFDDGQKWNGVRSFADLYWDAWERGLGRLLESPDVGHVRVLTEQFLAAATAWGEFRRAGAEYEVMLANAWGRAWVEFLEELGEGEPPTTMQELLRAWGQTVDQVMIEVFGTDEFARIQGRLLNATMSYRRAERGVVDQFLETTQVASKTDLDEVNRRIHDLRRELRELRKLVREENP